MEPTAAELTGVKGQDAEGDKLAAGRRRRKLSQMNGFRVVEQVVFCVRDDVIW